jgi:predicted TIM-barrel fold metal-dependent hydrolase
MNASSAQASSDSAVGGKLPAGTCDCHYHVFDAGRYPYAPERHYTPPDATLKDYLALCARFGIDRSVLVHPTPFGADHRSFEEVLTLHGDRMRGVAVVSASTTEDDIARWHRLGARGTRLTPVFHGSPHGGTVEDIVAKIKPFGWHVQLLVDVVAQPDLAAKVHALGVEVVVDHLGHHDAPVLRQSAGFANLLALLKEGVAWTKLSAPYRSSATSHADTEIQRVVDALLAANARQLVWGTDWPHPASPYPVPDDAQLVRLVESWLPSASLREQVLVHNPTRLYWT